MESRNHQETISKKEKQWQGWTWLKAFLRLFRLPMVGIIWLYQKTISPDHGIFRRLFPYGYCKFHPTCSEYGKQTIMKYGLFRGIPRAVWRIIRCNPWSKGGTDLP
jgi:putative membrane protein insertion efficiency factor